MESYLSRWTFVSTSVMSLTATTSRSVGYFSSLQSTAALLVYSVTLAFRFVVLMSSFSIFFLTTSPDDLSLALEQSHIPLPKRSLNNTPYRQTLLPSYCS
jgi:energy-coupling factor transporter transmembrane protein EcfT